MLVFRFGSRSHLQHKGFRVVKGKDGALSWRKEFYLEICWLQNESLQLQASVWGPVGSKEADSLEKSIPKDGFPVMCSHTAGTVGTAPVTTDSPGRQYFKLCPNTDSVRKAEQKYCSSGGKNDSALTLWDLLSSLQGNETATSGISSGHRSQHPCTTPFPKGPPCHR